MGSSEDINSFAENAVIKVCGVGGGGGNAVNRMIEAGLSDVQFIAINTDAQDLKKSLAQTKLQIGSGAGLGAGAKPEVGRQACEEDRERVRELVRGADMIFLTLGLGGGTGTGAAPIVAQEAADSGALTVAIVTLPFSFEGEERMNNALAGLDELEKYVDTLIVVPNDRIAELSNASTSLLEAFKHGDEVLHNGVRAISELITVSGLINLDFADIRTVMQARGRALMGIGVAEGEDRAMRAAREAVDCPLLEQSNINGAKGVIVNIRGGTDMRIQEVQQAMDFIRNNASGDAVIINGVIMDKDERSDFQVTVIAAGFPKKDINSYINRDKKQTASASAEKKSADRSASTEETGKFPLSEKTPAPKSIAKSTTTPTDELGELFNMENLKSKPVPVITTTVEDPDDINIPTFMRKRKNNFGKR